MMAEPTGQSVKVNPCGKNEKTKVFMVESIGHIAKVQNLTI